MVAKLLLVPACNLALVVAVSLALPATDPLVLLIMTVLGASPAAMNMRAAIPPPGQTMGQTRARPPHDAGGTSRDRLASPAIVAALTARLPLTRTPTSSPDSI